jgi:hypothetical protein
MQHLLWRHAQDARLIDKHIIVCCASWLHHTHVQKLRGLGMSVLKFWELGSQCMFCGLRQVTCQEIKKRAAGLLMHDACHMFTRCRSEISAFVPVLTEISNLTDQRYASVAARARALLIQQRTPSVAQVCLHLLIQLIACACIYKEYGCMCTLAHAICALPLAIHLAQAHTHTHCFTTCWRMHRDS